MPLRNLVTPVKQGIELTHLQLLLSLLVIELPSYQPLCGIHSVEGVGDRLHANIIVKTGTETCQQCAHRGFAFLCFAEGRVCSSGCTCRFAGSPTNLSPLSVKATTEGVVLAPSAFSMTFGVCNQQGPLA